MATLSSHLLNSVNGTHANNVDVIIYQIKSNGEKKVFYETKTDSSGRLLKEFILDSTSSLLFKTYLVFFILELGE